MVANPAAYVPRKASEAALAELEARVLESTRPVALTGPAGLGKTLLLRVLAERLRGRAVIAHVPYSSLPLADLCRWALEALGVPTRGDAPAGLLEVGRKLAQRGRPLILVVDEAAFLPTETARRLVGLVRASRGHVRLLVCAVDALGSGRVLAALGQAHEVRLAETMSADETVAYVAARLASTGVSQATRQRFDPEAVARLHRVSGGIPRRLHQLATERLLRGGLLPLPEVGPDGCLIDPLDEDEELLEAWLETDDHDAGAAFELEDEDEDEEAPAEAPARRPAPPSTLRIALLALLVGLAALAVPALMASLPTPSTVPAPLANQQDVGP